MMRQFLPVEEVASLAAVMAMAVKNHVNDQATLDAIHHDFQALWRSESTERALEEGR